MSTRRHSPIGLLKGARACLGIYAALLIGGALGMIAKAHQVEFWLLVALAVLAAIMHYAER